MLDPRDELIQIALKIAQQQRGENHLQPYDTIRLKLLREYAEFTEAQAAKSRLDVLSELADLVYYSCQEYAHDHDWRDLDATLTYVSEQAGVTVEQAYTVALAKYRLRSASPNSKDFEAENAAIKTALKEGTSMTQQANRDQYYLAEQARLRAIVDNEDAEPDEQESAQNGLKLLVTQYEQEFPTIVGPVKLPQTD